MLSSLSPGNYIHSRDIGWDDESHEKKNEEESNGGRDLMTQWIQVLPQEYHSFLSSSLIITVDSVFQWQLVLLLFSWILIVRFSPFLTEKLSKRHGDCLIIIASFLSSTKRDSIESWRSCITTWWQNFIFVWNKFPSLLVSQAHTSAGMQHILSPCPYQQWHGVFLAYFIG